jgi:hypothetical protein
MITCLDFLRSTRFVNVDKRVRIAVQHRLIQLSLILAVWDELMWLRMLQK